MWNEKILSTSWELLFIVSRSLEFTNRSTIYVPHFELYSIRELRRSQCRRKAVKGRFGSKLFSQMLQNFPLKNLFTTSSNKSGIPIMFPTSFKLASSPLLTTSLISSCWKLGFIQLWVTDVFQWKDKFKCLKWSSRKTFEIRSTAQFVHSISSKILVLR